MRYIESDFQRHVPLQGQPNFRDIGGYQTTDGRMVRPGLIYRSGELSFLGREDLATLEGLGIRTVVDFRTDFEIRKRGSTRLPNDAQVLSVPIEPVGMTSVWKAAFETGDFSDIPKDYLGMASRALVRHAGEQYGAFLRVLMDMNNLPLVFHCTHGKDRTGIAAMIVLLILGVPKETLRHDYLLSNVYREQANRKDLERYRERRAKRKGVDPNQIDISNAEAIFYLKSEYFEAAYDEILNCDGSKESFVRERLDINHSQVRLLRDQLTEL